MGWQKGKARGVKNGGRLKGTPNKKTQQLDEKLEDLGFDVIAELHRLLPSLDSVNRSKVLLNLLDYIYPRRKAIDLTEKSEPLSAHALIARALHELNVNEELENQIPIYIDDEDGDQFADPRG